MPHCPIRVVFILKHTSKSHGLKLAQPSCPEEFMGALRAVPRQASLARIQRALGSHYRVDLVSDGADAAQAPVQGLRLVSIELTAQTSCLGFREACMLAMTSMRLSSDYTGHPRTPLLVSLHYPDDIDEPNVEHTLGGLQERLRWFQSRLVTIFLASSAALEHASLRDIDSHTQHFPTTTTRRL